MSTNRLQTTRTDPILQHAKEFEQSWTHRQMMIYIGSLLITIPFTFLFILNSGYGYDALETLVIGSSIAKGYEPFHFVPSRPMGSYLLIAILSNTPVLDTPAGVASVIFFQLLLMIVAVMYFTSQGFNLIIAMIAGSLTFVAGLFMEGNFLIAEPLVVISGMGCALCLLRWHNAGHWKHLIAAGLALGIGFHFKQTTGFYLVAGCLWICWYDLFFTSKHKTTREILKSVFTNTFVFASGFVIGVLPVVLFFLVQGLGEEYLQWTFTYPLFHFPSSNEFLGKFFVKLSWFHLSTASALLLCFWKPVAKRIFASPSVPLCLAFALLGMYPLLKSQAPHYFLPSAAFLCIVVSAVWNATFDEIKTRSIPIRWLSLHLSILGLSAIISVILYQPAAFLRFVSIKQNKAESFVRTEITQVVRENEHVLFLTRDALKNYWYSHRFPNIPCVHFDVQSGYALRDQPNMYLHALRDNSLVLVQFNPEKPPTFRMHSADGVDLGQMWDNVHDQLKKDFHLTTLGNGLDHIWLRSHKTQTD